MKQHTVLTYVLLLVFQIILCNYLQLSPYLYLSFLPVMILCLPLQVSTLAALFIAFGSALAVDFLADGVAGLNALALVPVALLRKSVIRSVFGAEVISRGENISLKKHGLQKMTVAILLVQSLFLALYVWTDGAGNRSFWFNTVKFGVSLLAGYLVSLALCNLIAEDESGRWK